jgi:hypothetical protein
MEQHNRIGGIFSSQSILKMFMINSPNIIAEKPEIIAIFKCSAILMSLNSKQSPLLALA